MEGGSITTSRYSLLVLISSNHLYCLADKPRLSALWAQPNEIGTRGTGYMRRCCDGQCKDNCWANAKITAEKITADMGHLTKGILNARIGGIV